MRQELIRKIQMLETLAGYLRKDYGYTLESDEIYTLLNGSREEYLDILEYRFVKDERDVSSLVQK